MSMSGFEISAYILTFFLSGFGILFLILSSQVPPPEKKGIGSLILGKLIFVLFGLLYLSLANFTLYAGIQTGINEANFAPCTYILSNSTDINSTTTFYYFSNTCATREASSTTTTFRDLFGWVLWIDLLVLAFGSMLLFARLISKW